MKMEISATTWICHLPKYTQNKIREELLKRLWRIDETIPHLEILDGMYGKICDIEEVISLEEIREWV